MYLYICVILTYGAQTWSLTQHQKSKLKVCQRAMERSILGVRLSDRLRNTTLRSMTKIIDVGHKAASLKWSWAGHVCRMSNERWHDSTDWSPLNIHKYRCIDVKVKIKHPNMQLGCLFVNNAETTERILMKFGIQTGLTWVIGYFLSLGNVDEAFSRNETVKGGEMNPHRHVTRHSLCAEGSRVQMATKIDFPQHFAHNECIFCIMHRSETHRQTADLAAR
uniref:SFRICE_013508 n=1 Tax=Spodoptera frugiperda TaxID=7108 RepID=A0A2H1VD89_SPOFR